MHSWTLNRPLPAAVRSTAGDADRGGLQQEYGYLSETLISFSLDLDECGCILDVNLGSVAFFLGFLKINLLIIMYTYFNKFFQINMLNIPSSTYLLQTTQINLKVIYLVTILFSYPPTMYIFTYLDYCLYKNAIWLFSFYRRFTNLDFSLLNIINAFDFLLDFNCILPPLYQSLYPSFRNHEFLQGSFPP